MKKEKPTTKRFNLSERRGEYRDLARYIASPDADAIRRAIARLRCYAACELADWKKARRLQMKDEVGGMSMLFRLGVQLSNPEQCRVVPAGTGIGIELEFVRLRSYGSTDGEDLATLVLPGVDWHWDGSARVLIDNIQQYCQPSINEVGLFQKYGNWDRLRKVCYHLRDMGCRPYPTCGLHVHLDCRDVLEADARVRWQRLDVAARGWLHRLCPDYRRLSNYCRLTGRTSRYLAVNWEAYEKHRTVEVRYHHASLNADKIIRWVELLWWVSRCPTKLRRMEQFLASPLAPPEMKLWALWRLVRTNDHGDVKKSKMMLSSLLHGDEESEVVLTERQRRELQAIQPRPATRHRRESQ